MNSALLSKLLVLLRINRILSLQLIRRLHLILIATSLDACADTAENDAGDGSHTG